MWISRLILRQFRNYPEQEFLFQPGLNVLVGSNAAGKTNVLEAIFYLSTLHTNRTHNQREMIQHETTGMALEGFINKDQERHIAIKMYGSGRKDVRLNEKRCAKYSEIFGSFPVVWFSPEDLRLVKGEPALRRKWMSFMLSQTDTAYQEAIRRYQKIVQERNAALQRIQERTLSTETLAVWDEEFAHTSIEIMQKRDAMLREITLIAQNLHAQLHAEEKLNLVYKPSIDIFTTHNDPYAAVMNRLSERRTAELVMGTTLVGPHRDDIGIMLNNTAAKAFCSQGQQRSIVLAMKLAEIVYIYKKLDICPIGLFDDVLSEPDEERCRNFWNILLHKQAGSAQGLHTMQCLVTAVKIPDYVKEIAHPNIVTITQKNIKSVY